ncbi:MAG: peroxiredoxin [Thiolinea sp.]
MIQVGDKIPDVTVSIAGAEGPQNVSTAELFGGKKVVMFALPGAFTPTCSAAHLPGYVVKADELKEKGADMIACLSVNDGFVMQAWGEAQNAEQITMIGDGGGAFTSAVGLELDTADFGGVRSQRYAMIVDDGTVTALNVEAPQAFEVSSAEAMLEAM